MKFKHMILPLSAGLIATMAVTANAAQWDISVTNLTHGNYFTPLLVTAHDSGSHLYEAWQNVVIYPAY